MKYGWLAAIATLLSAGAADIADATTYKDIAGQWCGDVTDYVFTPNTLTVKFHDGRPANVFKITKYTYTNDSVSIDWLNGDGKESVTVFAEFTGNTTTMAQQQNGDKPRRPFHRC
jgi:hypothetical protein